MKCCAFLNSLWANTCMFKLFIILIGLLLITGSYHLSIRYNLINTFNNKTAVTKITAFKNKGALNKNVDFNTITAPKVDLEFYDGLTQVCLFPLVVVPGQ